MPAKKKRATEAKVYAFKFTIVCPHCNEPIKASDGGIVFTEVPASVECQACGRVSRVGRMIRRS